MLVGSFLAGCIPLSTKLSDSKLRHLTALGVGLLIGTALVVIIPEGIETMYSSSLTSRRDPHVDQADSSESHRFSEHTAIGLALVIGFAMMFIVDQLSSLHVHATSRSAEYSELNRMDGNSLAQQSGGTSTEQQQRVRTSPTARSLTPTIGLIVHAAADGVALGASASHPQLSMVVFLAIMLHKAPSAFALTTVLLAEGLSRVSVRRHLLIFSLSAPTGAVSTYVLLRVFSSGESSTDLAYWTGVLLIFSGGTFLYVAMHALQELHNPHSEKLSGSQVAAILGGMFLPILLNVSHSH
ncbi:Zinc/iron permease [Dichotomocladium elegans]|nr:Zinc/iron permease [Dichotomocladium elegans]